MGSSESGHRSDEIDCQHRPSGMVVQRRDAPDDAVPDASGPLIKIKVSYGSSHYDLSVPSNSTFGELKRVLAHQTGLDPEDQRLFFRGREKDDAEVLQAAGLKSLSKLLLMERPASKEKKMEAMKKREDMLKACEAVAEVRAEVDKLSEKVVSLQTNVHSGIKVNEQEFVVLTELLMRQLLKLDGIEAEEEARLQRKNEVRRVQGYVDALDALKERNKNPFAGCSNSVSVTTDWETFDTGVGSLTPPSPSSTKVTQDWQRLKHLGSNL